MTTLEDYLRDQYQQDKQQLKRTLEVVRKIAPIFVDYRGVVQVDKAGALETWPYKVAAGKFDDIQKLSDSTHCMIVFALDAILQSTGETPSAPNVKPVLCPPKLRVPQLLISKLASVVRKAKLDMIKRVAANAEFVVNSATFGKDDPFTLTWLAEFLLRWQSDPDVTPEELQKTKKRILEAATAVCARERPVLALPANASHTEFEHCFQRLRTVHLAKVAGQFNESKPSPLPLKLPDVDSFLDHLHLAVGYFSIPDSRFDPAVLVFAMEGALQFDPYALSDSTIDSVFRTLEASQRGNSYWRPVTPFLGDSRGMVLFPVSVEIANSLLRSSELLYDAHRPSYSSQLEPLLRRYVQWLLARAERVGSDAAQVLGWHSEHVNLPGTVHLWETSQVLFFLVHYCSLLQRKIASDGLSQAGLTVLDLADVKKFDGYWTDEPLTTLAAVPGERRYAVLSAIHEGFVDKQSSRSLMLYGPPGTGKTTVAEQLARALNQPLLIVTVSDFLAGAADEVEARAKGIFQVPGEQEDIVILFDEIDQFLLDRNSKRYGRQQGIFQFLTPGMLTKFQNLKDLGRSTFIVATNYEERIDSAIKRQGRFDHRLLLCLPDKERRTAFLWKFVCNAIADITSSDALWTAFQSAAVDESQRQLVEDMKKGKDALVGDAAAKGRFVAAASAVVNETALFGWGDLKYLVADELNIVAGDSWETIAAKLSSVRPNVQPSVRIAAYAGRFDKKEEGQFPSEELALLLYLVGECGQGVARDDLNWMRRYRVTKASLTAGMSSGIKAILETKIPLDTAQPRKKRTAQPPNKRRAGRAGGGRRKPAR